MTYVRQCTCFPSNTYHTQVNKKFFELKNVEYRDGIYKKQGDKTGMTKCM